MKNKTFITLICGLIAGVFGFVETVAAAPDGPQRLRGLGDRVFLVNVEVVSDPFDIIPEDDETFMNCYIFNSDGSWDDPLFPNADSPVPGVWEQHSVGAKTSYSASAEAVDDGFLLLLTQEGRVTPALGGGVLQITADTYLVIPLGPDFAITVDYYSVGFEVDGCPL